MFTTNNGEGKQISGICSKFPTRKETFGPQAVVKSLLRTDLSDFISRQDDEDQHFLRFTCFLRVLRKIYVKFSLHIVPTLMCSSSCVYLLEETVFESGIALESVEEYFLFS